MSALEELVVEWEDATRKAFDALARYKFWMFGYHAGRVVFLASIIGRMGGPRLANPFARIVTAARAEYCRECGDMRGEAHRCTSESLTWADRPQLGLLVAGDEQRVNDVALREHEGQGSGR